MPGRPRLREFVEKLELAAYSAGFDDPIDFVIDRLGSGETLVTIARDVGQMSRWTLWAWIKADEQRLNAYKQAKSESAHALVEQAKDILDTCDVSSPQAVAKARNQAYFRQWMASMYDRKAFGRETAPALTLNIGTLHLDTLRKLGGPAAQAPRALPEAVDAEIVDE